MSTSEEERRARQEARDWEKEVQKGVKLQNEVNKLRAGRRHPHSVETDPAITRNLKDDRYRVVRDNHAPVINSDDEVVQNNPSRTSSSRAAERAVPQKFEVSGGAGAFAGLGNIGGGVGARTEVRTTAEAVAQETVQQPSNSGQRPTRHPHHDNTRAAERAIAKLLQADGQAGVEALIHKNGILTPREKELLAAVLERHGIRGVNASNGLSLHEIDLINRTTNQLIAANNAAAQTEIANKIAAPAPSSREVFDEVGIASGTHFTANSKMTDTQMAVYLETKLGKSHEEAVALATDMVKRYDRNGDGMDRNEFYAGFMLDGYRRTGAKGENADHIRDVAINNASIRLKGSGVTDTTASAGDMPSSSTFGFNRNRNVEPDRN